MTTFFLPIYVTNHVLRFSSYSSPEARFYWRRGGFIVSSSFFNRTIGVGFSSLCARIGGMAAPYIVVSKQTVKNCPALGPRKKLQSWTKVLGQLFSSSPPPPHPTDSVEIVKAQFLWSFNIVLGGEGGGVMDLQNAALLFTTLLVIHRMCSLRPVTKVAWKCVLASSKQFKKWCVALLLSRCCFVREWNQITFFK